MFQRTLSTLIIVVVAFATLSSATSSDKTLTLPNVASWLTFDGRSVFALLESGMVMRVKDSGLSGVAKDWSKDVPIQFAFGRLHGVSKNGELQVLEGNRVQSSLGAKLSILAGVLPLPAGVIAVAASGDIVRLESSSDRWSIVSRAKLNALKDGRLALADLEGDGDPEVLALVSPSTDRYQHGVLGDATEATAMVALERHSLKVLWRYDLPKPFVFEDIMLRPIKLGTRDQLVVVRSGPNGGAALAVLGLSAGKLDLIAGSDFGQPNRWLNPLVGYGEIYAVHTPHIGGILNRYSLQNGTLSNTLINTLSNAAQLEGVSSHSIGSRNLESAMVIAPGKLIVPNQSHNQLNAITCLSSCTINQKFDLAARYSSNLVQAGNAVVVGTEDRKLHFWAR
jgi:hypothetical protein